MKSFLLNISIVIVFIVLVMFVLYFFNGSLEMFPTPEQQEKVHIVSSMGIAVTMIIEIVLIIINKKTKNLS